jgi:hypothetical protein
LIFVPCSRGSRNERTKSNHQIMNFLNRVLFFLCPLVGGKLIIKLLAKQLRSPQEVHERSLIFNCNFEWKLSCWWTRSRKNLLRWSKKTSLVLVVIANCDCNIFCLRLERLCELRQNRPICVCWFLLVYMGVYNTAFSGVHSLFLPISKETLCFPQIVLVD